MKKQFLKILILAIVFVSKLTVIAQPAEPGIPLGVSSQLSTSSLPIIQLPFVNNSDHLL